MRAPEFWYPRTPGPSLIAFLLSPLGALYTAAGRRRRMRTRPARALVPILCVGNLTAGGTGKTPVALALAARLSARGLSPVFLTRGYGGREGGPLRVDPARHAAADVGDEALLLARAAPTIVARDRVAGAHRAPQGSVIVMDDGFQNPSLAKDLSLVVIDGEAGVGNEHVIPAGPLREPLADGLKRADALVLVGGRALPPVVAALWGTKLVLRVALRPDDTTRVALAGQRVVAFAGIGRPEKFFQTLTDIGATLVAREAFADHHPFSEREIAVLKTKAHAENARLVTTEKDWVRLRPADRAEVMPVPVVVVFDDEPALDALLDRIE